MNKITLQSVRFKASEQLKKFVNEKVSKLFEQDESIIRADVALYEGESGNHENQFCTIQLIVPGENPVVKKNSGSYEKSVIDAVNALQKVLRRQKARHIKKRN